MLFAAAFVFPEWEKTLQEFFPFIKSPLFILQMIFYCLPLTACAPPAIGFAAMSMITTNCNPIRAPADEPTIT